MSTHIFDILFGFTYYPYQLIHTALFNVIKEGFNNVWWWCMILNDYEVRTCTEFCFSCIWDDIRYSTVNKHTMLLTSQRCHFYTLYVRRIVMTTPYENGKCVREERLYISSKLYLSIWLLFIWLSIIMWCHYMYIAILQFSTEWYIRIIWHYTIFFIHPAVHGYLIIIRNYRITEIDN